nr:hypothetical protein [Mesorhizobium carmichaelinearum]
MHQAATAPGVVIKCDLLGALSVKQKDEGGEVLRNDRYILWPHKEDAPDEPLAADHVPDDLRREIEQFFLVGGGHGQNDQVQGVARRYAGTRPQGASLMTSTATVSR